MCAGGRPGGGIPVKGIAGGTTECRGVEGDGIGLLVMVSGAVVGKLMLDGVGGKPGLRGEGGAEERLWGVSTLRCVSSGGDIERDFEVSMLTGLSFRISIF